MGSVAKRRIHERDSNPAPMCLPGTVLYRVGYRGLHTPVALVSLMFRPLNPKKVLWLLNWALAPLPPPVSRLGSDPYRFLLTKSGSPETNSGETNLLHSRLRHRHNIMYVDSYIMCDTLPARTAHEAEGGGGGGGMCNPPPPP